MVGPFGNVVGLHGMAFKKQATQLPVPASPEVLYPLLSHGPDAPRSYGLARLMSCAPTTATDLRTIPLMWRSSCRRERARH
jgi:hypothetical protein